MADQGQGTCLCGASRFRFTGAFKFAIRCFCRDCQKATGAGHAPAVTVAAEGFSSDGDIRHYSATADSGSDLVTSFCGTCGAPLFKTTTKVPDLVFLFAGALDGDAPLPPFHDVHTDRARDWDTPPPP